jgi:hypothetical protein
MRNIEILQNKAREVGDVNEDTKETDNVSAGSASRGGGYLDIIAGGRSFLPDVDFDKFEKYSYLFNESTFHHAPDSVTNYLSRNHHQTTSGAKSVQLKRLSSASTMNGHNKKRGAMMMMTITDPLGAIGEPAMYSRENARKAEKERSEARGATEGLNLLEREKLRQMTQ